MGDWYYSCDGVEDNGSLTVYDDYSTLQGYTYIFLNPCPYSGYITQVQIVTKGTDFGFGVFGLVDSVGSQRQFRLLRRTYPNINSFGSFTQSHAATPYSAIGALDSYPTDGAVNTLHLWNDEDPNWNILPGDTTISWYEGPGLPDPDNPEPVYYSLPLEINAGEYFGFYAKVDEFHPFDKTYGIAVNFTDFTFIDPLDGGYHFFKGDAVDTTPSEDGGVGQEKWFTREDHTGGSLNEWYSGEIQIRVFVEATFSTSSSSYSSSSSSQSISSTSYDSSSSLSSSSFSISSSSVSSSSVSSSSFSWSSESSAQGIFHDGFHFNYGAGDADWFIQGSFVHSGIDALQGGNITFDQSTRIDLDTDLLADGQLSFYWKVSSENNYDWLSLYINDVLQTRISGTVDWVQVSYHIDAGDSVHWVYDEDYAISTGSDTGWLDTFTFVADSSSSKSSSSESTSSSSESISSSSSSKSSFAGFWYGADGTPTVGIEGGNATYVVKDEVNWGNAAVQQDGFCTKIQFYVSSPGDFDFAAFTKNATQFTDVEWHLEKHFENGLHTYDLIASGDAPFQVVANETWLGFYAGGGGNIYYVELPPGLQGYWVDGGDQIGDGNPSFFSDVSNYEYQIRYFIEQSYSASSSSVSSSSVSIDSFWYGISTVPVNTTGSINSDSYTYIQKDAIKSPNGAPVHADGWVSKIQLYTYSAGDFYFGSFSRLGTTLNFKDEKFIESIYLAADTLYTLEGNIDFPSQAIPVSGGLSYLGLFGQIWQDSVAPGSYRDFGNNIGDDAFRGYQDLSSGKLQIRWLINRSISLSSSSVSSSSLSSSSLSSSSVSSSSSSYSSSSSSSSTSSSSSSSFSITEGFWYGKDAIDDTQVPDIGSNNIHPNNYTIIPLVSQAGQPTFSQPNPSAGYIDIIQFYLYDAGTLTWSTFTKSGSQFRDKNWVTTAPIVGSTPIGLVTLFGGKDFNSSELPFNVGEFFGFHSPTSQIFDQTFGGAGFYQDSGDQIGNNAFSTFAWNSADIIQLRVHVAYSISSSSSSSLSFSSSSSSQLTSSSSSSSSYSSSSFSFSNDFEHNGLFFNTSGDKDWFKQGSTVNTGPQAFQSGDITNNETTRIDLVNPAVWKMEFTFYWKVSSELNFDELRFYINGLQEEISGEVDWEQKTYDIYAGDVVYWEYDKDNSQSDGSDTAWLDTFTVSELSSSSVSYSSSSYSSSSSSYSSSSVSSSSESAIFTKKWGLNTDYQTSPDYYGNDYFEVTNIDEASPNSPDPGYSILKVGTEYDTFPVLAPEGKKRSLLKAKLDRLSEITNDGDDISFATLWIYGQINAASPIQPIDLLLYKILKTWNRTYASWLSNSLATTDPPPDSTEGYAFQKGLTHKQRWGTVELTGYPYDQFGMQRFWSTLGLGNATDRDDVVSDFYDDIIDPSPRWWSFNVTQDIKDFIDGIIGNNGWVLIQRPEDAINASNPGLSHAYFQKWFDEFSPYLEIGLPNYSSSSASSESSSSRSSSSLSSYSNLFSSSSSSRSTSISSISSSSSSASTAEAERVRRISAWSVNPEVQENHGVPTPQGDPEMHDLRYQPASSQFTRAVVVFLQYSTYSSYYSRNSDGYRYFLGWPDNPASRQPYTEEFYGEDSPLNPCGFDPLFPYVRHDYDWYQGKPDNGGSLTWGNPGLSVDWWSGHFSNQPSLGFPQEKVHYFTGIFVWYEDKIREIESQSGDNFKFNFPPHGTDFPLHGGQTNRDNYGPNGFIKMNIATFAGAFQPYKTDTPNLAVKETHYPISTTGLSRDGQTVFFPMDNDQIWPLHYDDDDYNPVDGTSPQSGESGFIDEDASFVGERRISGVGIVTQIGTVPSNRYFQDAPDLVPEMESELTKVVDEEADTDQIGVDDFDFQQIMYEKNDPLNTGNPAGRKLSNKPYTTYHRDDHPLTFSYEIERAFGQTLMIEGSPVALSSSASSISFSSSTSSSSSSESFSFSFSSYSSSSSSYSRACPDPAIECKVWPLVLNDVDNEIMIANFPPNVCVNSGAAFLRRADYIFEQIAPSTSWNIQHDMNTFYLLVQVYDDCRNHIFPDEIYIVDENNVQIDFASPMTGTAHLVYLERSSIYFSQDEEDIMEMGIGPNLGYWKVGDGTSPVGSAPTDWNPSVSNDLESPTASGSYWRIYENDDNYFLDFIVPWGEALTIREIGIFNVANDLMWYSKCSELHKPETARVVLHYEILKREVTLSSSSSSSSFSRSSSESSSSSLSSSSSSLSSSSSSSISSLSSSSSSSESSSESSSSSSSQSISSFVSSSSSSSSVSSSSSSLSSSSSSVSSSSSSESSSSESISSSSSSSSSESISSSSSSSQSISSYISSSSQSSSSSKLSSSSESSSSESSSSLSSSSSMSSSSMIPGSSSSSSCSYMSSSSSSSSVSSSSTIPL